MSARIHAWAGPSGIGTDPDGWMTPTGTADATALPPTARQSAAAHARSLRMTGEPNRRGAIVFNRRMLSLEEMSDRFEIQQLMVDYSTAIDQKRFDDLDRVFTPDAYIDYRVTGGTDGRFPEVKAWLKEVLPNFPAYYHMLGNVDIRIRRRQRILANLLLQPHGVRRGREPDHALWASGTSTSFIRTAEGWRMNKRVEEKCFDKLL